MRTIVRIAALGAVLGVLVLAPLGCRRRPDVPNLPPSPRVGAAAPGDFGGGTPGYSTAGQPDSDWSGKPKEPAPQKPALPPD